MITAPPLSLARAAFGVLAIAPAALAATTPIARDSFSRTNELGLGTNETGLGRYAWHARGEGTATIHNGELHVTTQPGGTLLVLLDTASLIRRGADDLSLGVRVRNVSGVATPPKGFAGLVYNKRSLNGGIDDTWCAMVNQALGLSLDVGLWRGGSLLASSDTHTGRLDTIELSLEAARGANGSRRFVVDGSPGTHGSPRFEFEDHEDLPGEIGYVGFLVAANPGQIYTVAFDDFWVDGPASLPGPGGSAALGLTLWLGAFRRSRRVDIGC